MSVFVGTGVDGSSSSPDGLHLAVPLDQQKTDLLAKMVTLRPVPGSVNGRPTRDELAGIDGPAGPKKLPANFTAQYGLVVEMVAPVTESMLQQAAKDWPALLVAKFAVKYKKSDDCYPTLVPPPGGIVLSVYVCQQVRHAPI